MQESLELLENEKEYPADETLVALVKLQLVGEEARKLIVSDFVGRDFGRLDPDKAPTYVFKRNLLCQLQKIRETLPAGVMSKGKSINTSCLRRDSCAYFGSNSGDTTAHLQHRNSNPLNWPLWRDQNPRFAAYRFYVRGSPRCSGLV